MLSDDQPTDQPTGADGLPTLFSALDLPLPTAVLIEAVRAERARLEAFPLPAASLERELLAFRKQQLVDFLAWLHQQEAQSAVSVYVTETDTELSDADLRDLLDPGAPADEWDDGEPA